MKIKVIDFGGSRKPDRAHYNDAGADVFLEKYIDPNGDIHHLKPHEILAVPGESTIKIPLGFGLELPDGFMGLIFPRSSLSAKGIVCELPPIDSGYRGEIHAIVTNINAEPYFLDYGDKIGQLVILPVVFPDFVSDLGPTRETKAFGSSGR